VKDVLRTWVKFPRVSESVSGAWPRQNSIARMASVLCRKIPIDTLPVTNVGRSFVEVRDMELLFIVSVTAALLWLAFGNKKDWTGM